MNFIKLEHPKGDRYVEESLIAIMDIVTEEKLNSTHHKIREYNGDYKTIVRIKDKNSFNNPMNNTTKVSSYSIFYTTMSVMEIIMQFKD